MIQPNFSSNFWALQLRNYDDLWGAFGIVYQCGKLMLIKQ